MFHGLDAGDPEESEAMVPAPVGPPTLGPFRRLNLELGSTYTASHDRIGHKVTVQVVRPMRREDRERIIHGIKAIQVYRRYPFIHRLLWITQRSENLYLVIEYPEDSLHSALTRLGTLEAEHTRRLFAQILVGISALHSHHVTHRNLTLRTVLLCDGVAKISGFDWVNQFGDEANEYLMENSLPYCSPEIVKNADITKYDRTKADMWSLGCILYAMVCGKLPFGECPETTPDAICEGALYMAPDIDAEVAEIIEALLHADPAHRPSAMQVLRSEWLSDENSRLLDDCHMSVPPAVVDDSMRTYGFPQDHVAASWHDSEYNLASAERQLVVSRLKQSVDETMVALVPSEPAHPCRNSDPIRQAQRHDGDHAPVVPDHYHDDATVPNVLTRRRSSDMSTEHPLLDHVDTDKSSQKCGGPWACADLCLADEYT
eukprot:m.183399 g.183399  ORF g.183399 m.183399 type:complete len:430 (+) comp15802_c0_seq1:616-1905(+)